MDTTEAESIPPLEFLAEFCTPIGALSPKSASERWFEPTGHTFQIPPEGRKPTGVAAGLRRGRSFPEEAEPTTVYAGNLSKEKLGLNAGFCFVRYLAGDDCASAGTLNPCPESGTVERRNLLRI
jgi:hypothetical protein